MSLNDFNQVMSAFFRQGKARWLVVGFLAVVLLGGLVAGNFGLLWFAKAPMAFPAIPANKAYFEIAYGGNDISGNYLVDVYLITGGDRFDSAMAILEWDKDVFSVIGARGYKITDSGWWPGDFSWSSYVENPDHPEKEIIILAHASTENESNFNFQAQGGEELVRIKFATVALKRQLVQGQTTVKIAEAVVFFCDPSTATDTICPDHIDDPVESVDQSLADGTEVLLSFTEQGWIGPNGNPCVVGVVGGSSVVSSGYNPYYAQAECQGEPYFSPFNPQTCSSDGSGECYIFANPLPSHCSKSYLQQVPGTSNYGECITHPPSGCRADGTVYSQKTQCTWGLSGPVCQYGFNVAPDFQCLNLATDDSVPVPGSSTDFTCTSSGNMAQTADFQLLYEGAVQPQYSVNDVPLVDNQAGYTLNLPSEAGPGSYQVQCRLCSANDVCTAWKQSQ